jgi:hypothetical protein
MNYSILQPGHKIFFVSEQLPMELIARTDRYACVIRSLDAIHDSDLLEHKVKMDAYVDIEEAIEDLKDCPVYSLIDFVEEKKAPSNLLFAGDRFDFWSKAGCEDAVQCLVTGEHELSRRNSVKLNIDWETTKRVNKL